MKLNCAQVLGSILSRGIGLTRGWSHLCRVSPRQSGAADIGIDSRRISRSTQ